MPPYSLVSLYREMSSSDELVELLEEKELEGARGRRVVVVLVAAAAASSGYCLFVSWMLVSVLL